MRHVSLTCIHHPALRWQCKSIATNRNGSYNGARHIFYNGVPRADGKGFDYVPECSCPPSDLRFAPEELERQKTEPLPD